ncbi:MAG: hypothetical protein ACI8Y7_000394 [Candidatus Woesearchaeota archaeon]|jgi:hypothetical protein
MYDHAKDFFSVEVVGDEHLIASSLYNTLPIKDVSYVPIVSLGSQTPAVFIDGGQGVLVDGAGKAALFVRVCAITENDTKITSRKVYDAMCYITRTAKDAHVLISGDIKTSFTLDCKEDMKTVYGYVRQWCELHVASISLKKGELVVLDGSLRESECLESVFTNLYSLAGLLCGIVKTSTWATTAKRSIQSALSAEGAWLASGLITSNNPLHRATIHFVRLHPRSDHIFRLEIAQKQCDVQKICSRLARVSRDAVFLGYPYPLISVDDLARVSKEELVLLQTRFLQQVDNRAAVLQEMRSSDAHTILDSLKF